MLSGFALKCYVCNGNEDTCSKSKLEGDKDTYLETCDPTDGFEPLDRWIRIWEKKKDDVTKVRNYCGTRNTCDSAKKVCDIVPGGVLRYISDGDVRSPFLGLKFAIWGLFLGLKFRSDFFWVRDFGKDFFWVRDFGKDFLGGWIGLFMGYVLGRWTFFGLGSSLKDFFWV